MTRSFPSQLSLLAALNCQRFGTSRWLNRVRYDRMAGSDGESLPSIQEYGKSQRCLLAPHLALARSRATVRHSVVTYYAASVIISTKLGSHFAAPNVPMQARCRYHLRQICDWRYERSSADTLLLSIGRGRECPV